MSKVALHFVWGYLLWKQTVTALFRWRWNPLQKFTKNWKPFHFARFSLILLLACSFSQNWCLHNTYQFCGNVRWLCKIFLRTSKSSNNNFYSLSIFSQKLSDFLIDGWPLSFSIFPKLTGNWLVASSRRDPKCLSKAWSSLNASKMGNPLSMGLWVLSRDPRCCQQQSWA